MHGKSVPRSRPTMFWDPQNLDLSVNLDSVKSQKTVKDAKHKQKKLHLMERNLTA